MATVIKSSNPKFLDKQFTCNKNGLYIGTIFKTTIELSSVTQVNTEINQHVGKGMLGTIGGAVVGGILTGGVGVLLGALACGNGKRRTTKLAAIEYGNKEWIVVDFEDGMLDNLFFKWLQRELASTLNSPFAG